MFDRFGPPQTKTTLNHEQPQLGTQQRTGPPQQGAPPDSRRPHTPLSIVKSETAQGVLKNVCILLVEDTMDMRHLLMRMLAREGAEVYAAASVKEARELLTSLSPDVIVSDIAMPEEDGLSFLHSLRSAERKSGHHIPAIALTAFVGNEFRHLTFRAGYEEHLCKPVSASVLVSTILQVLRSAVGEQH